MISVLASVTTGLIALIACEANDPANQVRQMWNPNVMPIPVVAVSKPREPLMKLIESLATPKKVSPAAPASPRDILCSLESSNLELPTILKALSDQTKVNLILLGASDSKLTVRLKNVRLHEMLNHICALSNLAFVESGSTYVVAPEATLKERYPKEWNLIHPEEKPPVVEAPVAAKIVTRIYRASYMDAARAAEMLGKMFGDKLTSAGAPSQISPSIGERDTMAATGMSQGVLRTAPSTSAKLLVLRGPEDIVEAAYEMAKQMDVPRKQVSIAVTIHDISNDALKELGLAWEYGNLTLREVDPKGINFGSFTRAPFSAVATIHALERSDRAKLLASPNISVLDNENAFILIGNRLNFPVLVGFSQANTPIFDKQEERVGIYLQVSASIGDDNQVTLSLYPQVSTVTGFLEVNGGSYPQISTREAQTTLRVRTGETIVMGGMLKDEELASVERVPILGQIPFLGELFTHRKKTKTSSQVIITITPTVIEDSAK